MIDFYDEFDLDPQGDLEQIKKQLSKTRKKWALRLNAPDLSKRQEAERTLRLIDDAEKVFESASSRTTYDKQLNTTTNPAPMVEDDLPEPVMTAPEPPPQRPQQPQPQQPQQQPQQPTQQDLFRQDFSTIKEAYQNKDYATVINIANDLLRRGHTPEGVYYYLAYSLRHSKKYTETINILKQGLQKHPNSSNLHLCLVSTQMRNLNDMATSKSNLNIALDKFPDDQYIANIECEWMLRQHGFTPIATSFVQKQAKKYNNDKFSKIVSDTLLRCGDSYLIENRYFKNSADYRSFSKSRQLAKRYYADDRTQDLLNRSVALGKKTFYSGSKKYWIGALVLSMVFSGFQNLIGTLLSNLLFVAAGLCLYAAWEPKWATVKRNRTHKDHFLTRAFDPVNDAIAAIKSKSKKG